MLRLFLKVSSERKIIIILGFICLIQFIILFFDLKKNFVKNETFPEPLAGSEIGDVKDEYGALSKEYINYLSSLKGDSIASVSATLVCSGEIEEIFVQPLLENNSDSREYERGLKLKNASTYDCTLIQFDKISFQKVDVLEKNENGQRKILFDDLKVGDRVVTKTVINLLKPGNDNQISDLIKTTIIKLQKQNLDIEHE